MNIPCSRAVACQTAAMSLGCTDSCLKGISLVFARICPFQPDVRARLQCRIYRHASSMRECCVTISIPSWPLHFRVARSLDSVTLLTSSPVQFADISSRC